MPKSTTYLERFGDAVQLLCGGVSREQDRTGRWIDFQAAHELFDPVAVDAACATKKGKHA